MSEDLCKHFFFILDLLNCLQFKWLTGMLFLYAVPAQNPYQHEHFFKSASYWRVWQVHAKQNFYIKIRMWSDDTRTINYLLKIIYRFERLNNQILDKSTHTQDTTLPLKHGSLCSSSIISSLTTLEIQFIILNIKICIFQRFFFLL